MSIKALADRGIAFADAIPDSLVALIARLAVGGVFWRSGQTKIEDFTSRILRSSCFAKSMGSRCCRLISPLI
jgi:uncharacterized membrane protein YphA (DoxX/SURF4 family)